MAGRKWWQLLIALWFILYGLLAVTNITVIGVDVAMGFLAIIAGLLLLVDR